MCLCNVEQMRKSILHLTNAIKVTEDSVVLGTIYSARSLSYQMVSSIDKATKDIEQSLKYNPNDLKSCYQEPQYLSIYYEIKRQFLIILWIKLYQ